jgi:hypothetical protein
MVEIARGCRAFDEDLSAWIDGELGGARRSEVGAHVAGCRGCAERVEQLRAVDRALRALPAPAVRADLRERLARRLAADRAPAAPPPARTPERPRRRLAALLALPAAAAALLTLYLSYRPSVEPVGPGRDLPIAAGPAEERPIAGVPGERVVVAEVPAEEVPLAKAPEATPPASADLEALDAEELAVVLDLDTIEDLPVIATLEVLERLLAAEAG